VERTELEWVHLGFEGDDEAMTERRLRQGNLVGPAGYISLEDGLRRPALYSARCNTMTTTAAS